MVDDRSVVSDEWSRVKAAVSDALRRNDVTVDALLRIYAIVTPKHVHDVRCESSSSTSRSPLTFTILFYRMLIPFPVRFYSLRRR